MKNIYKLSLVCILTTLLITSCNEKPKRPKLKVDKSNSFRTMEVEEDYKSKQDSISLYKKETE
jgi:hypothetical protein